MALRDDFSTTTVKQLALRVVYRCSHPDCRKVTAGPGNLPSRAAVIGVAAHIHAAAPGGPRFLAEMTQEQRRDFSNGIWMCADHAALIDRLVEQHPAELLLQWKRLAEERAGREIGQKLPKEDDAQKLLASTLTGLPTTFLPTAVSNVHKASVAALEQLDPRFNVESSYENRMTRFTLRPKEDIPFTVTVPRNRALDWRDQMRNLVNHGKRADLNAEGFAFKGSPLFSLASDLAESRVILEPRGLPGILRIQAQGPKDGEQIFVVEAQGKVTAGLQSFRFTGVAFGGFLGVEVAKTLDPDNPTGTVNLEALVRNWEGRPISDLPYFDKLESLFRLLSEGWKLDLKLEMEGQLVLGAHFHPLPGTEAVVRPAMLLDYLRRVRVLSTALKQSVTVSLSESISAEDNQELDKAVQILEGQMKYRAEDLQDDPSFTITADRDANNIKELHSTTEPRVITVVYPASAPLLVMGQSILLPQLQLMLESVVLRVPSEAASAKEGESVRVECTRAKNFLCSYSYVL